MENTRTVFRDSTVMVSISIGISTVQISDDNYSVDKLINNADIALYKAKNSGRNRICVYNDED